MRLLEHPLQRGQLLRRKRRPASPGSSASSGGRGLAAICKSRIKIINNSWHFAVNPTFKIIVRLYCFFISYNFTLLHVALLLHTLRCINFRDYLKNL